MVRVECSACSVHVVCTTCTLHAHTVHPMSVCTVYVSVAVRTYVRTYIHTIVHWYMFFLILNRCCLWASLAKISRKHEVWDVSLVASRYCLLYNDGRWDFPGMQNLKMESLTVPSKTSAVSQSSLSGHVPSGVPSPKNPSTSSLKEKSQKSLQDSSVASTTAKSVASSEQETKERKTGSGDREMLRLLSTVTCLHGDVRTSLEGMGFLLVCLHGDVRTSLEGMGFLLVCLHGDVRTSLEGMGFLLVCLHGDVRTSLEGMGYLFSYLFLHSILFMLGRPLSQIG